MKRTVLAGFFSDCERRGDEVVLTVAPPEEYRSHESGCLEVVSDFICIASASGYRIDRSDKRPQAFSCIAKGPAPVRSECMLIGSENHRELAVVRSTNRTAIVDGKLCLGLYEVGTQSPLKGQAGAAIVWRNSLIGMLLGTLGKVEGEWRSFAIGVNALHDRLAVLQPIHEKDKDSDRSFRSGLAEFRKSDRRLYEEVN